MTTPTEHADQAPAQGDAPLPRVRISGPALLAAVELSAMSLRAAADAMLALVDVFKSAGMDTEAPGQPTPVTAPRAPTLVDDRPPAPGEPAYRSSDTSGTPRRLADPRVASTAPPIFGRKHKPTGDAPADASPDGGDDAARG